MRNDLRGIGMTSQRTRDRLVDALAREGIQDSRVLEVMRTCPRHIFIEEALAHRAYENTALPIGSDQTISQPYIVARMTEILLDGGRLHRVLEVGTGSGYQTAVLAALCDEVYSVERIRALQEQARQRLRTLGIRNVQLRWADGTEGWPEKGPYDGIMVTAAPARVPQALREQLAPGGRMVVPLGTDEQWLTLIVRDGDRFTERRLEPVRFVPFLPDRSA